MRHNKIERIGVYKLALAIEELGWIFREQPIVDVGIDALIEQSINGNPTGKFLAIQLKSGSEVTRKSNSFFTYYISNIHYNYWLSLEIPLIIVAYRPDEDKLYWEILSKQNIRHTTNQWKIDIPKSNVLSTKAESLLNELLEQTSKNRRILSVTEDSIYNYIENMNYIIEAKQAINNLSAHIEYFDTTQKEITEKIKGLLRSGYNDKCPQFKVLLNKEASTLNILSSRLINEIKIFSETFTSGAVNFQKVSILLLSLQGRRSEEFDYAFKNWKTLPSSFNYGLDGLQTMYNGLLKIPKKDNNLIIAQKRCKEALESILLELNDAKELTHKIIDSIEKTIQELNL